MGFNALNPRLTTPSEITSEIREFSNEIVPNKIPLFVPVEPVFTSQTNECFFDVQQKVASDGGTVLHGWTIWETPRILLEAEFHAVWLSPANKLIDISPKPDGEQRILFLPDSNRIWRKEPVDNVRKPLIDNAYTRRLIKFGEAKVELQRRYYVYGKIVPIPRIEVERLVSLLGLNPALLDSLVGRNDPCPCGSGKKYKKCHGA